MEISQSQEWLGRARKKQTAANKNTAKIIAIAILETFWLPRYRKPSTKVKFNTPIPNKIYQDKDLPQEDKIVNHLHHRLKFGTRLLRWQEQHG